MTAHLADSILMSFGSKELAAFAGPAVLGGRLSDVLTDQVTESFLNPALRSTPDAAQTGSAQSGVLAVNEPWRHRHMRDLMLALAVIGVVFAASAVVIAVLAWQDPRSTTQVVRDPIDVHQVVQAVLRACREETIQRSPSPVYRPR
jgi:hypothetical protein